MQELRFNLSNSILSSLFWQINLWGKIRPIIGQIISKFFLIKNHQKEGILLKICYV